MKKENDTYYYRRRSASSKTHSGIRSHETLQCRSG